MKRVLQVALPGVLAILLLAGIVHIGISQEIVPCPALRTDALGFPLFPPYSEYLTGGGDQTLVGPIEVTKILPCCVDGNGNQVDADLILETCPFGTFQVGTCPDTCCPVTGDVFLTEVVGGAVKLCDPTLDPIASDGGGSNFLILIGDNGN